MTLASAQRFPACRCAPSKARLCPSRCLCRSLSATSWCRRCRSPVGRAHNARAEMRPPWTGRWHDSLAASMATCRCRECDAYDPTRVSAQDGVLRADEARTGRGSPRATCSCSVMFSIKDAIRLHIIQQHYTQFQQQVLFQATHFRRLLLLNIVALKRRRHIRVSEYPDTARRR